ncbi:MAG TPA: FtsK/SpoIIIE domain-containing protein [Roseiflexaceae bacterium]|nr:FtsK/SpoIIIE domain-containing protein [Roseiflexaceae bacterium]
MEWLYGLFALVLLLASGGALMLVFRRQRHQIAALADQLEQANQARQASQRERDAIVAALDEPRRKQLQRDLSRARPLPNPPGTLDAIFERLRQPNRAGDPLAVVVGWYQTLKTQEIGSVAVSLSDTSDHRSGNIMVVGSSGHGKGTLGHALLLQLAHRNPPTRLKVQIIDPKRSDGALWAGAQRLAHLWRAPVLGDDPAALTAIIQQLEDERKERDTLREQHRVREWHELPEAIRPPHLVVWIPDFAAVLDAIGEERFGPMLRICRSSGITFVVDIQNPTGEATSWRKHFRTIVAGALETTTHILPTLGMAPNEIVELGGTLPTELRRGQFTLRQERDVVTVSTSPLSTATIVAAIATLPVTAPPVATAQPAEETAAAVAPAAPKEEPAIPDDLVQRIVDAAQAEIREVGAKASRTKVYYRVFGQVPMNGQRYEQVKRVLDQHKLLLPTPAGEVAAVTSAATKPLVIADTA